MTFNQTIRREGVEPIEAPGKRTLNLRVEGIMREVIIYRPINLPANKPVPVVFVFHGTGGSGEVAYDNFGWKEKADREGFMAVFPSALRYHIFDETLVKNGQVLTDVHRFTTKWNFFGLDELLDPAYPQRLFDDVKFVLTIIELLNQYYAVDAGRFYVTGFSNGGQFAQRLLVQLSNIFAAFTLCSIGRGFTEEDVALASQYTNEPFKPRPVMHMIGELDPKLNYAAKVEAFPMDVSAAAPGAWTNDRVMIPFVTLLGLPSAYEYRRTAEASIFHYGGTGTPTYDFIIVEGMRHIYPNGENFNFKAADVFWLFMKQHQR